jgi:hypothetical protein
MLCAFLCLVVCFLILQVQVMAQVIQSETNPITADPVVTTTTSNASVVTPTPVPNKRADRTLTQAYRDTFKLLSEPNDCSSFYGGPKIALLVLNEFFSKLRKEKLPDHVALTMSGKAVYVLNTEAKVRFRVFEQTVVNESGSFYLRHGPMGSRIPNIGSFLPATRSARALTLLHELGHMIRSPSGKWLIQDDGNNSEKSRRNTEMIENACRDQLKTLQ